jgi:Leucine rich repeat
LGFVWTAEEHQLTCNNRHDCTFNNFRSKVPENYDSVNLWSAKTLIFTNSSFDKFPKHIANHFSILEKLQVSDCNMIGLDGIFQAQKCNKLGKLTTIDFSRNQLSKVEPLDRSPYLKHLNLSTNRIEELQIGSFAGLKYLKVLDLGANNISKIESVTFSKLENLEKVILAENKLTELPENVFSSQTNLIEIDLSHNRLKTFDLGTVGSIWHVIQIKLAQNNIQSLKNLSTLIRTQNKISIDFTDNKWNCLYAQKLEKLVAEYNCEFIGNIVNCSLNWLDSTIEKFEKWQNNKEKLDERLKLIDKKVEEIEQKLIDQGDITDELISNISQKNGDMTGIFDNTIAELKLFFEKYNKGKVNINLWMISVILMATTILTAIVGAFAVSFVKKYRVQYKFEAVKDLIQN